MPQFSIAVRNAILDVIETTVGGSAKLQVWTGVPPIDCASAASGIKLAEYPLAADWAAAASAGSKSLSSTPLSTTGIANGLAGYYRIVDTTDTTCHEQGTITAIGGGGDMEIENLSIAIGQIVRVMSFTKTAPGA